MKLLIKSTSFFVITLLFLNVTMATEKYNVETNDTMMEEQCSNGIDDDMDGLVDCLDSDCAGSTDCCGPDSDGDGIGDFCDMDDDNDGIPDDKECPPDTLMINADIHDWVSINGDDINDIQIGDVYTVRNHYQDDDGQMFDLRFELINKVSEGVGNTNNFKVNFSAAKGVQIEDAIPGRSDHIIYSLNWVLAGTLNSSNLSGDEGVPFEFAEITIFDLDNSSLAGEVGYTDVGFFIDDNMDVRNFQAGSEVEAKSLIGGQVAFGLQDIVTENAVDVSNPCDGCQIKASIPSFTGATLLHGVFGTSTTRELTRQAQWRFRVARCPDYDGDGLDNLVDKDSDNDGCVDAIEGSAAFSQADLSDNDCLAGEVDPFTGIPLLAGDCQFVGVSQDSTMQDSLCVVPEICDNGIDDDGDGDIDCADDDVSDSCCCREDLVPISFEDVSICPEESTIITIDQGYESVSIIGISSSNADVNLQNVYETTLTLGGDYVINAMDSCQENALIDTFSIIVIERNIIDTSVTLCLGESFSIGNNVYSESGMFTDTLQDGSSCGSILSLNLNFFEAIVPETVFDTICIGESVEINGITYDTGGAFTDVISDGNGCPAERSIMITEIAEAAMDSMVTICAGESVTIDGVSYSDEGTFVIGVNDNGTTRCGTNLTLTINFYDVDDVEPISETICIGESVVVNGISYNVGGSFIDQVTDANGCTIDRMINITAIDCDTCTNPSIEIALDLCNSSEREYKGIVYNQAGKYTQLIPGTDGCDTLANIIVSDDNCMIHCCTRTGNHKIRVTKKYGDVTHVKLTSKNNTQIVYFDEIIPSEKIDLAFKAFSLIENNYEQSDKRKIEIIQTIMKGQKLSKNTDLLTNFDTHKDLLDILSYSYYNLQIGASFEL